VQAWRAGQPHLTLWDVKRGERIQKGGERK
jgi:hypothetical protein